MSFIVRVRAVLSSKEFQAGLDSMRSSAAAAGKELNKSLFGREASGSFAKGLLAAGVALVGVKAGLAAVHGVWQKINEEAAKYAQTGDKQFRESAGLVRTMENGWSGLAKGGRFLLSMFTGGFSSEAADNAAAQIDSEKLAEHVKKQDEEVKKAVAERDKKSAEEKVKLNEKLIEQQRELSMLELEGRASNDAEEIQFLNDKIKILGAEVEIAKDEIKRGELKIELQKTQNELKRKSLEYDEKAAKAAQTLDEARRERADTAAFTPTASGRLNLGISTGGERVNMGYNSKVIDKLDKQVKIAEESLKKLGAIEKNGENGADFRTR